MRTVLFLASLLIMWAAGYLIGLDAPQSHGVFAPEPSDCTQPITYEARP